MGDSLSDFLNAVNLSYYSTQTGNRKELRNTYLRLKMIYCRALDNCQCMKLLCEQLKYIIHLSYTFERLNEMKKADVLISLISISYTIEQHQSRHHIYVVPNVEGMFDRVCKNVFYGIFPIHSPTLNQEILENLEAVKRERANCQICLDMTNVENHIKTFTEGLNSLGLLNPKKINLQMMLREFLLYYPESCDRIDYAFYSSVFREVFSKELEDESFLKKFRQDNLPYAQLIDLDTQRLIEETKALCITSSYE